MTYDTIVIGGGPAGLSAAILRAGSGDRVLLVEKRDLPRTKCCGEFLHPSAVAELSRILPEPPAGNPIRRVRIYAGATFREFAIQATAMGMDRARLSQALLSEATRRGVQIVTHREGEIAGDAPDSVDVRIGPDRHSGARVVVAEGSASAILRKCRGAGKSGHAIYGFSARVSSDQQGLVALAAVSGGYVGLCDLGAGTLNLAGLLTANAYRRLAPTHERFGERLVSEVRAWEGIVPKDCVAELHQVPATAAIVTSRDLPTSRIFVVGDSAGMSETAFGDGIARALRQSRFLDEAFRMFPSDLSAAAQSYDRRIRADRHRPDRGILKIAAAFLRSPAPARILLGIGTPYLRYLTNTAVRPA